jgi:ubiquinone/menaquinone biosynthesis C-methylase UbiE
MMPNFMYRAMSAWISIRGIARKPMLTLTELGIKKGQKIVDYGAGPGAFTIPAALLVGENGDVTAVDIHPLSKKIIERKARKKNLKNIKAILANINTNLPSNTTDIVFLFDVIHSIKEKSRLFKELHRILKTGSGILYIRPDHITNEEIKSLIKSDGLFLFHENHGEILEFRKLG